MQIRAQIKMFTLQQVIAALVIGIFIGANVGIVVLALMRMAGDCDRHMPDIEDVNAKA